MSTTTVSGPGDTPAEETPLSTDFPGTPVTVIEDEEPAIIEIAPPTEPPLKVASVTVVEADGTETDITHLMENQNDQELFDTAGYRIETPTFDNLASDKLILSLGGPIELDPASEDDLALFENFMLGKSVNLLVHGSVVGKLGSYKENADGEVTVTGKATVKIHSLTLQSS